MAEEPRSVRVTFTLVWSRVYPRRQEWRVPSGKPVDNEFVATARPELPGHEGRTVEDLLNEAPTSKFHRRTVIISGVGFFTDAYDLFVIGTVAALVATQWHLSTRRRAGSPGRPFSAPSSAPSSSVASQT